MMGPWESRVARTGQDQWAFTYTITLVAHMQRNPKGYFVTLHRLGSSLWCSETSEGHADLRRACDLHIASLVLAGTLDPEHLLP